MYKYRFLGLYLGLGAVGCLSAVLTGVVLALPRPDVKKAEVVEAVNAAKKDAVGEQNLTALCEAQTTQAISQAGGQVKGYKPVSVKVKGDTAVVYVRVTSDIYTGKVKCDFQKSNWSATNVGPAS